MSSSNNEKSPALSADDKLAERGGGRNRSEVGDLDRRIHALDADLSLLVESPQDGLAERALLFTLEAYAAVILQRLRAELFEKRIGMPKSDADVFSLLTKSGLFDLSEGRQLRQFCEVRNLSARDYSQLNLPELLTLASDREWIRSLLSRMK